MIGFAGLGIMGSAMTGHLLTAGHELMVWNRSPSPVKRAREAGAVPAEKVEALGKRCDVIHLSLLDTEAVEAVVFGPGGILSDPADHGLIVDHSTVSAVRTREFADRAAGLGWQWVDAPVSGGRAGVEVGSLSVFCGGSEAAVEKARPTIRTFAKNISRMGGVGAGQATKAVNQSMVGGMFILLAEALNLAERNDIDVEKLPGALSGGFGDSTLMQCQFARMARGPAELHGAAAVMLKDMELVRALADQVGAAMPLSTAATNLWRQHIESGDGASDWVSIVELIRSQNQPSGERP